jgi:hypothetical protein
LLLGEVERVLGAVLAVDRLGVASPGEDAHVGFPVRAGDRSSRQDRVGLPVEVQQRLAHLRRPRRVAGVDEDDGADHGPG